MAASASGVNFENFAHQMCFFVKVGTPSTVKCHYRLSLQHHCRRQSSDVFSIYQATLAWS